MEQAGEIDGIFHFLNVTSLLLTLYKDIRGFKTN
jgi:hypothetical protein